MGQDDVEVLFERGARAWPRIELAMAEFAAAVDDATVHGEDLFLARACCLRRRGAAEAFEAAYSELLTLAVPPRLRASGAVPEDFASELRQRLLVGTDEPLLARYRGHGALGAWLRVTIARAAISAARKRAGAARREAELPDLLGVIAAQRDPELDYLRHVYRDAFRVAFEAAVTTLSDRERALIRLSLVRGVPVRKLGTMYGVGHSTAARWVNKAVGSLSAAVRSSLAASLGTTEDLDSIMRLLDGSLELSVSRILDTP